MTKEQEIKELTEWIIPRLKSKLHKLRYTIYEARRLQIECMVPIDRQ